jgi:hypothetical protein
MTSFNLAMQTRLGIPSFSLMQFMDRGGLKTVFPVILVWLYESATGAQAALRLKMAATGRIALWLLK